MFGKKLIVIDEASVEKACSCALVKKTKDGKRKVINCFRDYQGDKKFFYDYDAGLPQPICKAMNKKNNSVDLEKFFNCPDRND